MNRTIQKDKRESDFEMTEQDIKAFLEQIGAETGNRGLIDFITLLCQKYDEHFCVAGDEGAASCCDKLLDLEIALCERWCRYKDSKKGVERKDGRKNRTKRINYLKKYCKITRNGKGTMKSAISISFIVKLPVMVKPMTVVRNTMFRDRFFFSYMITSRATERKQK